MIINDVSCSNQYYVWYITILILKVCKVNIIMHNVFGKLFGMFMKYSEVPNLLR